MSGKLLTACARWVSRKRTAFVLGTTAGIIVSLVVAGYVRRRRARKAETTRIARLETFLRLCPKVELHAHLHGSIRMETLTELCKSRGISPPSILSSSSAHNRDLSSCFAIFDAIHKAVDSVAVLRRVVREVLQDFDMNGVVYLELRSTPRTMKDGTTIDGYVDAVLDEFRMYELRARTGKDDDETAEAAAAGGASSSSSSSSSLSSYNSDVRIVGGPSVTVERPSSSSSPPPPSSSPSVDGVPSSGVPSSSPSTKLRMIPRLLLSFDRSKPVSEALAIASLAVKLFEGGSPYVVGVDLGGNPTVGRFEDFVPALQQARDAGLKVSVHCGEVPCKGMGPLANSAAGIIVSSSPSSSSASSSSSSSSEDLASAAAAHAQEVMSDLRLTAATSEAFAVLRFRPDRLGHALFLPTSVVSALEDDPIPVECCPTSNVMTLNLQGRHEGDIARGLRGHPMLERWLEIGYPISISTDDSGVFATDSTKELRLLASSMNLEEWQMSGFVWGSLDHVFDQNRRVRSYLARDVGMAIKKLLRRLDIPVNNGATTYAAGGQGRS